MTDLLVAANRFTTDIQWTQQCIQPLNNSYSAGEQIRIVL